MDRRVVVGLVGIALAGSAGVGRGQTAPRRDPSGQPPVGMAPIPSIADSINNTSFAPPPASSSVPTSPVGPGQDAVFPKPPIPSAPISMAPIEPIKRSINRGFGFGTFGSMFRRPADQVAAPIIRASPRVEPAPKADASVPSIWSDPPQGHPLGGRPAPFANRSPEGPRVQAEPPVTATGRPAPFADDRPRAARPRTTASNTPAYRPAEIPSTIPEPVVAASVPPSEPEPMPPLAPPTSPDPAPAPATVAPEPVVPVQVEPAPPTTPTELPPPPALEPASVLPVIGPDPPKGLEPVPTQELPAVAPAPVEPAPLPAPSPAPVEPAPSPSPSPVNPAVNRTSLDQAAVLTQPVQSRRLPHATMRAAAVGDEIITFNELDTAVGDQVREMTQGRREADMSAEERRSLYQLKNQVAATILNRMIDQALVIQEAKRKMQKNPKAKQAFDEEIDKEWKAKELPPLLRKNASANVHELKVKLTAEGKSYESMKEQYRKNMLFHEFLRSEIHNKVTADLPEMKAYYNDHRGDFDQPERITWREVEIGFARHPSRAAARQKAEEVLARLLRGEDFDAVARSTSNGPTASKGGLYVDMQPGSYGIPAVNDELNRLPAGQVSTILEAPTAFHIIRVESRREKGPLRFDEVQDKIRGIVINQNAQKAVEEYMAKLRAKTLIRTMFDKTASDPELARRNDSAVRQAGGSR